MLKKWRSVALAAAAVCASSPGWAIDLAEAYRLALQQDATIRASRSAAEAGRERLPQARAQFFPNISASSGRWRNDLETTQPNLLGQAVTSRDLYNSSNDAITVRQPIFRKQLTAQYRQAQAQVDDVNAVLERDEQNLVMRVTQTYFEILLADEQLVLISLQRRAYEAQLDGARKSFTAGSGTRTDIDEAQARLDLTVAQELEGRQALELAQRRMQVLINQPVTPLARVDVAKLQLNALTPADIESWTAQAEAASPEMQSAKAQVEAARAEVDKARAGHYPTLDATAQISRSSSENVTRISSTFAQKQIGLQLSIPIFQGGYVNSQVREALALLERGENRMEELRRDLGVRVHDQFRGVVEGGPKVRALEVAVRSSEQLVQSSRRSFEAGARTRIDILNAEQQAGQAKRDLAQARFQYLLARVRLKALAGGFKAENIDEINGWLQH